MYVSTIRYNIFSQKFLKSKQYCQCDTSIEYWNGLWTERHGTSVKLMMQAGLQQGSQFLVPRQGTPNFLVSSASPRTRHPAAPKSPSVIPHRPGQTRSLVFVKTLTRFLTTGTSTAAMHTPANLANTVLVPRVHRPWHRAFQRTPRYRCCCCYSRRR